MILSSLEQQQPLLALGPDSLGVALGQTLGQNLPGYRAKQILEWIYAHGVDSFGEMTNLPSELRADLSRKCLVYQGEVVRDVAADDATRKLLIRWPDGGTSECVLIPSGRRKTACISTQIGCPVRCAFCASGLDGLERNLSAAQIVEQALRIAGLCSADAPLDHVVFMGLGEPLANYDATLQALRTINADWGLGIGARRITVSTVGLPTQMRRLADEHLQITLALSLHAPTDTLRRRLIPWAERVTIDELVDACRYYFERTTREVTLEYILLDGVNNSQETARQLAVLAKRMRSNINLIAYNPVVGLDFKSPGSESVHRFQETLRRAGVNVHIRRSRGSDVDAACGQLRRHAGQDPH